MFESSINFCRHCPAALEDYTTKDKMVCVRFDAPLKVNKLHISRCSSCKKSYPRGIMWASLEKRS